MPNIQDLTGQVFNRLTVLSFSHVIKKNRNRRYYWLCKCKCNKEVIIRSDQLKGGGIKSCGCLQSDELRLNPHRIIHGMCKTSEFKSWCSMKRRCYDPKNKDYHNYGGRGVTVCERWLNSFKNFFADMGKKPSPKHSLDKDIKAREMGIPAIIYSPEMCCWATQKEQQNNRCDSKKEEIDGIVMNIMEMSKYIGVSHTTFDKYSKQGLSGQQIKKMSDSRKGKKSELKKRQE